MKEKLTKLIVLGGLGEVGKNMYAVEYDNEIIIIDAGISFPEDDLGIDYVLPDFTYLKENQEKIKALFITHGHEDHIGSIPFLVQSINIPEIYAPNQARELISIKLADRNIRYDGLKVYNSDDVIRFKNITIDFFRTTHSIPDSHGICITTPDGTIATTGDFKFDLTPIGPMADLHKMAEIGKRGVDLLISDSTNALNEGMSISESKVDGALSEIFDNHPTERIIVATFASNIYRLKHIFETCYNHNRKICIFGRSMENNINISINGGYINHKELLISAEEANNLKPGEVCLLCTGSQGEPLAALSRIADGTHRQINLRDDDVVIFSSSAIPGNQLSITRTINKLYLRGVKVFTNTLLSDIHTSGHANQEELKLMIRLLMPKNVMPFHGDYRMLKRHADTAVECGIPKENTFVIRNGDVLLLQNHKVTKSTESVSGEDVFVDANRISEISSAVIRDRKIMANDGILVIIANINSETKELLIKPNITTRGFILVNENEELIKELETFSYKVISKYLKENGNLNAIKPRIIAEIIPFVEQKTGRRPIILPILTEIDPKKM